MRLIKTIYKYSNNHIIGFLDNSVISFVQAIVKLFFFTEDAVPLK